MKDLEQLKFSCTFTHWLWKLPHSQFY